jgi:predicted N-acetyltransferase YhbS
MEIKLRPATPSDARICGTICHDAFRAIAEKHGFPPPLPDPGVAIGLVSRQLSHPGYYAVVAELEGRVVGSNFLDERSSVAGIGPITVDPTVQNSQVGRRLMQDVLERTAQNGFTGARLVQDAYHNRSLCLYTKLGFEVREPLAVVQGQPPKTQIPGCTVRQAGEGDLNACNDLSLKVHGHHRGGELLDAINDGTATLVERDGRITAYATAVAFFGHALAETNEDLKGLIASAPGYGGPGFLLPTRNGELFRWCLQSGLRVVSPATLMSIGLYNEPKGAFLPSIQ